MGKFVSIRVERGAKRNPVYCRICGRAVRSNVGDVCSQAKCHRQYLVRADKYGW